MAAAAKKVLEQALDLSHTEREEFIGVLSRGLLPVELNAEWEAELVGCVEKIESARGHLAAVLGRHRHLDSGRGPA